MVYLEYCFSGIVHLLLSTALATNGRIGLKIWNALSSGVEHSSARTREITGRVLFLVACPILLSFVVRTL